MTTVFSIIIPSWNNLLYLQKCIKSIRENSKAQHQIIIHVNDGNDGTLDWLNEEKIECTISRENIGICLGFNKALEIAVHQYVMYMNDDMYVLPGWDLALARAIPDGDHWMLSATMIEPVRSKNRCNVVADYGTDISSFREAELLSSRDSLARKDWHGASWPPVLLSKKMWMKVKGLSPEFSPGMYSDPDLSMKIWREDTRYFRGVGDSLVYHFQAKSTGRVIQNNGRMIFMKKWGITPSFFYNNYLKMGVEWNGPTGNTANPALEQINRLRVRMLTLFS